KGCPETWHLQAGRGEQICRHSAPSAAVSHYPHPPTTCRHTGDRCQDVDHLARRLDQLDRRRTAGCRDDVRIADKSARVRRSGAAPGVCAAAVQHNHGLTGGGDRGGDAAELSAVLEVLEVAGDGPGRRMLTQAAQEVDSRQIRLIADGYVTRES